MHAWVCTEGTWQSGDPKCARGCKARSWGGGGGGGEKGGHSRCRFAWTIWGRPLSSARLGIVVHSVIDSDLAERVIQAAESLKVRTRSPACDGRLAAGEVNGTTQADAFLQQRRHLQHKIQQ